MLLYMFDSLQNYCTYLNIFLDYISYIHTRRLIYYFYSDLDPNFSPALYRKPCRKKYNFNVIFATIFCPRNCIMVFSFSWIPPRIQTSVSPMRPWDQTAKGGPTEFEHPIAKMRASCRWGNLACTSVWCAMRRGSMCARVCECISCSGCNCEWSVARKPSDRTPCIPRCVSLVVEIPRDRSREPFQLRFIRIVSRVKIHHAPATYTHTHTYIFTRTPTCAHVYRWMCITELSNVDFLQTLWR